MTVRIAEIDAASTTFPIVAPFDGDAARSEMRLPVIEFVLADGERHMQHTITTMAGNSPAGQGNGLFGSALTKDQEDIASGHRISGQPIVAIDWLQPEHALVEGTGPHHVLGMDRSFQDGASSFGIKSSGEPSVEPGRQYQLPTARRTTMLTYVVLATFTDQGVKNAKDSPKRAEAFKQMAKTFGVTVKDIFWTQGRYDVVTVVESPDELSATALNLSLGALGNIRTESLRAFSSADMMKIVAKML